MSRASISMLILYRDSNNTARVLNTHLENPQDQITPLLNPSTGQIVPGFPNTSSQLGRMSEQIIDAVLEELGIQPITAGTSLANKKKYLRGYIGLGPERKA